LMFGSAKPTAYLQFTLIFCILLKNQQENIMKTINNTNTIFTKDTSLLLLLAH